MRCANVASDMAAIALYYRSPSLIHSPDPSSLTLQINRCNYSALAILIGSAARLALASSFIILQERLYYVT